MKWLGREGSDNVEDRRGMSGRKVAVGGGIGTVVVILIVWFLGGDPSQVINTLQGGSDTEQVSSTAEEDQMAQFVSVVLKDTETVWGKIFEKSNSTYHQPKLVQRTIRSGFKVSHNGHIMVMGDVNPGGEIYAGGNVVVWGRLKGMAFAGMEGDENAVICALEMEPMQLRIAGFALSQPTRKLRQEPEMAYIKNGRVVIEPWKSKR
jgi:septum site-determining protein MinC